MNGVSCQGAATSPTLSTLTGAAAIVADVLGDPPARAHTVDERRLGLEETLRRLGAYDGDLV